MAPREAALRRQLALELMKTRTEILKRSSPYAARSLQLDSVELDEEYQSDLVERMATAFSMFPELNLHQRMDELKMILQSIVYYCTVWKNKQTPGQALFGISYSAVDNESLSEGQRICLFVTSILLPYIFSKFSNYVYRDAHYSSERDHRLKKFQLFIERAYRALSLLNLLAFIFNGKFKSLSERLCHVVCRSAEGPSFSREMEFDVINRELIWHEFSEMVLLFLPLLGSRLATEQFPKLSDFFRNKGKVVQDERRYCPACLSSDIQMPFACVPCEHVYCYYCIASRVCTYRKSRRFRCLKCTQPVEAIKRILY